MSIKIDKEFESLIPPLSAEEFKQLEENCVKDGIRDPLILWHLPNGDDILVDGHNRWKIAAKHGGIQFETKQMTFDDRDEVKAWIIKNQFGRRNLSAYDRSLLALKLKPLIAEKAKKKQSEGGGAVRQKSDKAVVDTKKELAKVAGVSHDTINKVERIEAKATPYVKAAVRKGDMSINKAFNSTFPKREDPVKAAKREHLEYELSKGDIVDIKAARKDKVNQEIISGAMVQEVLKFLGTIQKFSLYYNDKDLSVLRTELDDDTKSHIKGMIKNCHMTLDGIARAIDGGKYGKN